MTYWKDKMDVDLPTGLPIITPSVVGFSNASASHLSHWVGENIDHVVDIAAEWGGILFRFFEIDGPKEFGSFCDALPGYPMQEYKAGAVKRNRILGNVFNSTQLNSLHRLAFHNEMAYLPKYPRYICFYSNVVAMKGGSTLFLDTRRVWRDLPSQVKDKFREKRIRYVRTFDYQSTRRELFKTINPLAEHMTWQAAMGTSDRKEAEAECEKLGLEYEWDKKGRLKVVSVLPALVKHPLTGDECFCNQVYAQHFNPRAFGRLVYAYRSLAYRQHELPNHAYWEDGKHLERDVVEAVIAASDANEKGTQWRSGDIVLLDNIVTSHGRAPYIGKRRVMVGIRSGSQG